MFKSGSLTKGFGAKKELPEFVFNILRMYMPHIENIARLQNKQIFISE